MAPRSRTLRYKLLIAAALFIVVGWSVFWFIAATIVDRQVERAEIEAVEHGGTALCHGRNVTGFPFRMEVRCKRGTIFGNKKMIASVEGFTIAGLVYNPNRFIMEVASPVVLAADDMPDITANWELAHASARLDLSARTLERFDAELVDVRLSIGEHEGIAVAEIDANIRRNPVDAADLDLALSLQDLALKADGEAATLSLQLAVAGGAALLGEDAMAFLSSLSAGKVPITIEAATFQSGAMRVAASGELTLGADGKLDGKLEVAVTGHNEGLPYVAAVAPGAHETLNALVENVLAYAPETTVAGRQAKVVNLAVEDGTVRAGFVPLFTIPPLEIPQR